MIAGIEAASAAGLAVKINMVALKGINEDEFASMLAWCGARGFDLTLIEAMPVGEVEEDRSAQHPAARRRAAQPSSRASP